uniref:Gustatory receptor n=1 Tax=Schizaphis graminum TaxID=13262 RepID=A0A2S2NQH8_SCHGA
MRKNRWNLFFISLFIYFFGLKLIHICMWPPRTVDVHLLSNHIFGPPFIVHFVVVIFTCLFLYNLYIRFETLNDLWTRLPVGLIVVPDQRTHIEITILIDNLRLLHSELSGLLKIFSLGYGPLLVPFFASNFINTVFNFFSRFHSVIFYRSSASPKTYLEY